MSFFIKIILKIIIILLAILGAYHLFIGDFRPFKSLVERAKSIEFQAPTFDAAKLKNTLKDKFQVFFSGVKSKFVNVGKDEIGVVTGARFIDILKKASSTINQIENEKKASVSPTDLLRASLSEETATGNQGY